MKQNNRAIVRRRTQQLVYLELGRENGGVMLNLSEEGCGFQAITPVKIGETRFGFQINGGRRIAGDAEIVWADESGVMGGLRFIALPPEARKEIRSWLEETNAPVEYGYASAAAASAAAAGAGVGARPNRVNVPPPVAPDPFSHPREAAPSVRIPQHEAPPPPPQRPAYSNSNSLGYPVLDEPRYNSPFTEAIVPYQDQQQHRSASVWRGIAVAATVVAVLALGVDVPEGSRNSLIWLGETLSGNKTKASSMTPADKPADNSSTALRRQSRKSHRTMLPTRIRALRFRIPIRWPSRKKAADDTAKLAAATSAANCDRDAERLQRFRPFRFGTRPAKRRRGRRSPSRTGAKPTASKHSGAPCKVALFRPKSRWQSALRAVPASTRIAIRPKC